MKSKEWMSRVAALGCILCKITYGDYSPAVLHHIGDNSERDDFLVIPLCHAHHQGNNGFHGLGERAFNARYRTSEVKLLAETLRRL